MFWIVRLLGDENTVRTAGRDEIEKQYGVDTVNKQHGSLGPIGLGANALWSISGSREYPGL